MKKRKSHKKHKVKRKARRKMKYRHIRPTVIRRPIKIRAALKREADVFCDCFHLIGEGPGNNVVGEKCECFKRPVGIPDAKLRTIADRVRYVELRER